jgi:hypothetical protein
MQQRNDGASYCHRGLRRVSYGCLAGVAGRSAEKNRILTSFVWKEIGDKVWRNKLKFVYKDGAVYFTIPAADQHLHMTLGSSHYHQRARKWKNS